MRSPACAVLSLLLLSPALTAAAPHDTTPCPDDAGTDTATTHTASPRPWRRLSDAIIRKIWRLPDDQKSVGRLSVQNTGGALGDRLLAQYGEEVVLRFKIRTADEAKALAYAADTLFLDVWEFNDDWADIHISKHVIPSLIRLLPRSLENAHEPLMPDTSLAQAIFDTYPSSQSHQDHFSSNLRPSPRTGKGHPFFQDYQPLSVITPWMNLMASMFTTHVRLLNIGISYQGRDIPALRVGVHPTNKEQPSTPRKTVIITAGTHAREWISTSTVNYLAWSLINGYAKDRHMRKLLQHFDFVFVPTLNPDGYVYSWEQDRLWRKNRQPTSLSFCRGIDLDRSYPFQWDGASGSNPCSEAFPGGSPFEGVEAARFAEWAKNETQNNNVDIVGFLDLHSYSQQILYPYSYSCNEDPPSIEDLEELALGLAKAIRVSRKGASYKVTSACEGNVAFANNNNNNNNNNNKAKKVFPGIESSGGSALDWFYHELKVRYSYQIKLRDTGSYGFLLPKENIVPTGEEILKALLYFGDFMLGNVGMAETEVESVGQSEVERNEEESESAEDDWVDEENMEL